MTDPQLQDLFAAFLPMSIKNVPIRKYLLDRTRHLPRDFLQLPKAIQVAGGDQRGRLSEETVTSGVRNYSREYLLPEVRDEVAGHFSVNERDAGFDALATLAKSRFTVAEFEGAIDRDSVPDFDAKRFLSTLYDCGAVGNSSGGIYTFRFRNPHVPIKTNQDIVLHKGLAPAMNISQYGAGS